MRARGPAAVVLAAAVAVMLIWGCGGSVDETVSAGPVSPLEYKDLKMTSDGYSTPENVAVLMAEKEGYFRDAGLNFSVAKPASPIRPIPYVVTGTDDVGISHQPEVELAQREGTPVVVLGSLVAQPTAAMIWLKRSGIDGIADLKGKVIGIPGLAFQERFLGRILARAGLSLGDVEVRKVGYELVPKLVSGRVDAIFGGSSNLEGIELDSRGLDPVVTGVESLGLAPYDELVVVTSRKFAEDNPRLLRDFMNALARGTAAAKGDPAAAAKAIETTISPNPETTPEALRSQLAATLPILSEGGLTPPESAEDP
jgi:putative hydroxymethylpyrimidine transport system substrate-binding protein